MPLLTPLASAALNSSFLLPNKRQPLRFIAPERLSLLDNPLKRSGFKEKIMQQMKTVTAPCAICGERCCRGRKPFLSKSENHRDIRPQREDVTETHNGTT
ncbi:hypothetical protein FB480_104357 [Agrobacterium vitis]|nr:hypothetical protein FB480_104357 [Agrobacterium vitis]